MYKVIENQHAGINPFGQICNTYRHNQPWLQGKGNATLINPCSNNQLKFYMNNLLKISAKKYVVPRQLLEFQRAFVNMQKISCLSIQVANVLIYWSVLLSSRRGGVEVKGVDGGIVILANRAFKFIRVHKSGAKFIDRFLCFYHHKTVMSILFLLELLLLLRYLYHFDIKSIFTNIRLLCQFCYYLNDLYKFLKIG